MLRAILCGGTWSRFLFNKAKGETAAASVLAGGMVMAISSGAVVVPSFCTFFGMDRALCPSDFSGMVGFFGVCSRSLSSGSCSFLSTRG